MKAIFIKELREHFKVSLIGLLVFSVMLVFVFKSGVDQFENVALGGVIAQDAPLQPLLAETLLTQASFFCGLFGILLGGMQIRAEKHPDLWAFQVHRPISLGAIFRAKIFAGLVLYALGAGLPLAGLVLATRIPGNIAAPFEWAMVLPVFVIFLLGTACYLAGVLIAVRDARWYGSRIWPLGAAVAAWSSLAVPEFWHALAITTLAVAILATAARAGFQTRGSYTNQPIVGKLALTVACSLGAALLMMLALAGAESLFGRGQIYTYAYYQITRDGSIYKVVQHGRESEVMDLNGKPALDPQTGQKLKAAEFGARSAPQLSVSVQFPDGPQHEFFGRHYTSSTRFYVPWRVMNKTFWYLTAQGQFVGYDATTGMMVGSLSPPGRTVADSRFIVSAQYRNSGFEAFSRGDFIASTSTLYFTDFANRSLKPLFTVTNGDAIGGLAQYSVGVNSPAADRALLATRASIRLFDSNGTEQLNVPYVPAYPDYSQVTVSSIEPTNTYAVQLNPDPFATQGVGGKPIHVKWVGADGNISKMVDLPKLPDPARGAQVFEKAGLLLTPPGIPFYPDDARFRVWRILSILPAVLCAFTGWLIARRYSFPMKSQVAWAVCHLLFGLPGFLAFLAVQEWPARERCPSCKKLRVVTRETCEHCGAEFAPPPAIGIEIFEPLVASGVNESPG